MKTFVALLALTVSAAFAQTYPVTRVIDGDTVVLEIGGEPQSTRLLGVDTPEVRGSEPYAAEATAFTRQLLEGRRVRLEYGYTGYDIYGRLLAHVFVDDQDVSLLLAEAGLAKLYTKAPPDRYTPLYAAAVAGAFSARKGLHTGGFFLDRNCADFANRDEAQAFMRGAETPRKRDAHGLDNDADGVACAALPKLKGVGRG